jgi:bacterial/archaeal transporter family-2 protein
MSSSLTKATYDLKVSVKHPRLDALAILSGAMIAVQARANGELSAQMGNSLQAALISFSSGLLIIAVITVFSRRIKDGMRRLLTAAKSKEIPKWRLFAGMLGGSFVAIQTNIVPIIGVALYSVASIAGQALTSLLVDRIGITAGGPKAVSARRVGAAAITVFAVAVSVIDRLDDSTFTFFPVFLAVIAGAFVGVQRALNGQINEYSGESYATSFLNFIMGTAFLVIFLLLAISVSDTKLSPLPQGPWWIYTGGVIGVIYIAFTALIVQHLGVLTFTVLSVGGQLFGSLLLDLANPETSSQVGWALISGIALTYLGILVSGERKRNGKTSHSGA